MHELARRHNLSRNLIRLWIQKYEAGELTDEVVDAVRIAEYQSKIAEPERKVGQLTMEVDLLKKGAQLGRRPSDGSYSIVSGPKLSRGRPRRLQKLCRRSTSGHLWRVARGVKCPQVLPGRHLPCLRTVTRRRRAAPGALRTSTSTAA